MPNRLARETSPYLQQHAHNPVDWYPWGEEALTRARQDDRPILLSIGYSACHWCHVMERESFENPETARLMNELFVNIKVDREERPDLDSIYMDAVQAMTGSGGWPMTVFLTPEGEPFFGGTYFPPDDHPSLPGFPRVLRAVAAAYRDSRAAVLRSAAELRDALGRPLLDPDAGAPDADAARDAYSGLEAVFDHDNAGFGPAPKFPQPMVLGFLLRYHHRTGDAHALAMVRATLDHMSHGGIYDALGGGFHRYATDALWLVPHFEKMLYDNALLAHIYIEAYQVTGESAYRRVAEETLDYIVREMTSPQGGFYASQDADSAGDEGRYYLWTPDEIDAVVGPETGAVVRAYYGIDEGGNTAIPHRIRSLDEVATVLHLSSDDIEGTVTRARPILRHARARREKPERDEKIITAWNGLALRSFAVAARVLGRHDYLAVAEKNANFLLNTPRAEGRLLRTYKDGKAHIDGYLEDYADLADGLLALYDTTGEPAYVAEARTLVDTIIDRFWDDTDGVFFTTGDDHETLYRRPKDLFDNAVPSGNSVAVDVLLHLARLTGERPYEERATRTLSALSRLMARAPSGFGRLLGALEFTLMDPLEVAIVGEPHADDLRALLAVVHDGFRPEVVTAVAHPAAVESGIALLDGRTPVDGRAAAYVCRHFTCRQPVTTPDDLRRDLASMAAHVAGRTDA